MVGDAFELAGAGLVVEDGLAREADLVCGRRIAKHRPEHPRDHVPEAVDVVVALHHVGREVVVVLDERLDGVGEHRQRDQAHTRDGVVNRQLRGVEQVLQDDSVGGLLDDLQADQALRGVPDDAALLGRDAGRLELDDVEAADVHGHHRPGQFVWVVQPVDVERALDAVLVVFGCEQQQVLFGVELDDAARAHVVRCRPVFRE